MKKLANIALVIGVISLIVGVISRVTLIPIPIALGKGIEAQAFLSFTNTCVLFAIALILLSPKQ